MINNIVWCMIIVSIDYGGEVIKTETAAKGIVTKEDSKLLTVDFSEYADTKMYIGDYSKLEVLKDNCMEDKK